MKKILLFILLLFLGFSYGYSQYVPIQIVTEYNDPFLRYLPLNQMVYCKDSDAVYMLDIPAFPISKLSTTANHRVIGFTLDTTGFVMWTDTLVLIATKHDLDTLSNSVYDSLSNHYDLIHGLDTGKVSTSGDIMYGGLNIKQGNLSVKGTFNVGNVPLGTDIDSVTVIEDGQLKSVDGSSFKPDSTSAGCFNNFYYKQITGCDNNNLYIKADTTKFSNYIKLPKFANNNSKPVLSVTSTGKVDTISVKDIDENYVRKSGDTLNGVFDLQSGDILLTKYAAATGDKVAIIKESGILDTIQSIPIESAIINNITLIDSIIIGGITHYNYSGNLLDDADFTFPLNSYGFGNVYVFNAGMKVEYCRFILNVDGSFELQDNSGNVEFSNVDGNVCLYSNAIQNRLGATRYFMIELKKN